MSQEAAPVEGIKSAEEILNNLPDNTSSEPAPNPVEPTPEPSPEPEPTPEPPKEDPSLLSKGFAALKRREKAIKDQEAEMKQRIAELENRQKELESSKPDLDSLKQEQMSELLAQFQEKFKADPFNALKEFGTDYGKLTELAVEGDKPQYLVNELKSEFDKRFQEFEGRLADKDKVIEELKGELEGKINQQKDERMYEEYMKDLSKFVDGDAEKYKFIKHNNALEVVADVVAKHYEETQTLLSNEEAADIVEKHYRDEARKYAELMGAKMQEPATPPKASENIPKQSTTTLSNKDVTENTSGIGSLEGLSEDEQERRLIDLIQFNN